ncbi:YdbL family protein [Parvibaculum sp.]|uniref:YdbL family protein n=1 Tax=Parvibaculum sp. TaxID=2024848 RepID=UPI002C9D5D10|nr:YdbL family protein [Parvibaculum sp.]HUD49967.1 YdbL family protein [Parvibaculum sp.]
MRPFKSFLALLSVVCALGLAMPALAIDLDGAKAEGLVGERQDGYVGVVAANPPADLKRLVDDINLRRRGAYQKVVSQTPGATLAAVEKLAAAKLIAKTPSGQIVQDASGNWVKKP